MARGMSSTVRPLSSDCLAPAISGNRQGTHYMRRVSTTRDTATWQTRIAVPKTPTDLSSFDVIYGVLYQRLHTVLRFNATV